MRVLIAPASFKGSLSAAEAAAALAVGAQRAADGLGRSLILDVVPLADGGEGTVDAVQRARGGELRTVTARDPLGRAIQSSFLLLDDGTAVIEMAAAAGLPLLSAHERNPLRASTHGVGDLIAAAVCGGARRLVVGVGGSATVDGGAGMAQALGARLLDAAGAELAPGGGALSSLDRIDLSGISAQIRALDVDVLCDVSNPLTGPSGAAYVFGPQKGATPAMVRQLDAALERLATVVARDGGPRLAALPGAGAAGGLAAGLCAFLGARLRPGIEVIMDLLDIPARLAGASLVLTGEGRLDAQTAGGKVIAGLAGAALAGAALPGAALAGAAQARGVPLVAIAGGVAPESRALYARGLTAAFSLADGPRSLRGCETDAPALLERAAENVVRLWLTVTEETSAERSGAPHRP